MKKSIKKAFTLVELLVVITILAIISVVAYQNFGWAVDKAVSGRKINDVSTIETALQQFKVDNNYYPQVDTISPTNMWWYSSWTIATQSNTLKVNMNGAEITSITSANWWWTIMNTEATPKQIWAKWTLSQTTLWKKYLSKDLYDPEVGDLKESSWKKLIESWIGRYVYAIYKKPTWTSWWSDNKVWSYYNIAYTIKKDWSDTYYTKIVWDYDSGSCFDNSATCPATLIWSGSWILVNEQEQWKDSSGASLANFWSNSWNQWVPYSASDFE